MIRNPDFKSVATGKGRCVSLVGDIYRLLLDGEETGGKFALIEAIVAPQGRPPPHIHRREDESFYVLEGDLEFSCNGKTTRADAGSFLHLPKDSFHWFKNVGTKPARMLMHVIPAGLEKFFLEVGHSLPDPSAGPAPVTPADIEKLKAIAPKYGLELTVPAGQG